MATRNPFHKIKLVYQRSSLLLKLLVLVTILVSTAALLALRSSIGTYHQQMRVLQVQAAMLQEENQELAEKIAALGSKSSIRRIATEELGLVDPDAQFFVPGQ